MTSICVIPARGGSKGIIKKNLCLVNNETLLKRVILKAKSIFPNNKIYVSSDDDDIICEAQSQGVNIHIRKPKHASDECSTEDSLLSLLDDINSDAKYLIFAQCTSPFMKAEEFSNIKTKLQAGYDSAFSVYPSHDFQWKENYNGEAVPLVNSSQIRVRRQDSTKKYVEAGSVYGMLIKKFKEEKNRFCGNTALNVEMDGFHFELDKPRDLIIANLLAPYFD